MQQMQWPQAHTFPLQPFRLVGISELEVGFYLLLQEIWNDSDLELQSLICVRQAVSTNQYALQESVRQRNHKDWSRLRRIHHTERALIFTGFTLHNVCSKGANSTRLLKSFQHYRNEMLLFKFMFGRRNGLSSKGLKPATA